MLNVNEQNSQAEEPGSIKLLHIEDEAGDAVIVAFELENAGLSNLQITHVERLADAINELQREKFDVALSDLNLPDSTGIDTFKTLRDAAPDLPVVLLTGFEEDGVASRLLEQGVQDYLPKKYLKGDLLGNAIRFAIERQRLKAELEKRANDLIRSEGLLRRIIETATDAIFVVEDSKIIRFCNSAAQRLFESNVEELLNMTFTLPIVSGKITEQKIVCRNKLVRTVEMHAVDILWEDRIAELISLRDITERKVLEQKLAQSMKMDAIGQLTGGLAHEFNNLLGVIVGNLDILEKLVQSDKSKLKHVQVSQNAALSAANLTKRLLAFARKQTLTPTRTSINKLIKSLHDLVLGTLGPKIEYSTRLSPDDFYAVVDRSELEGVMLNLALNSADAMPSGGKLEIQTSLVELESDSGEIHALDIVPGKYGKISVVDSGKGMTAEVLQKVFDPFFTTKNLGEGAGMGMPMVYGFVKQSKGYIDIESKSGEGTTVNIFIPLAMEEEHSSYEPKHLQDKKINVVAGQSQLNLVDENLKIQTDVKNSETILVVDDSEELVMLAEMLLQQEGYTVITANSAKEALAKMENIGHVDLVFTDIMMPGDMNGIELGNKIFSDYPESKVLFTSGYSAEAVKDQVGISLAGKFLKKPYRNQDLVNSVRDLLEGI